MIRVGMQRMLVVMLLSLSLGCSSEQSRDLGAAEFVSSPPAQVVSPSFETGGDWPNFLGPDRNGVSGDTGLLVEWPEEGPPLVWEREIGEGYGAPVIADGKLVFFHRVGNNEVVECVSAVDGSEVFWTQEYPTRYRSQYGDGGGPRSSATIVGDRVFTFGAEGVLTCLDFDTGDIVWQREVNKQYKVSRGFFGAGTAPVVEGDILLLNVGGAGAGVVGFDISTGEPVWQVTDDAASYSTPIVATINGERLAIFHSRNGLLILEPTTGELLHSCPFASRINASAIAATPVVIDDLIFLSGAYGVGSVVLRITPDGLEEVWKSLKAMQNHWATSIYHEGYLYGVNGRHESGSKLRCIDFETGEIQWDGDRNLNRVTMIMADGRFIAVTEKGELGLLEVNPKAYKKIATARVMPARVQTPPVLAQGLLYLRSDRELKCFNLRQPNSE